MQDIDFSQHTQHYTPPLPPEQSPVPEGNETKKRPAFLFTPLLVTALLTFSVGLISGIFLGQAKNIESNMVSRPDKEYFQKRAFPEQRDTNKAARSQRESSQNKASLKSFTNISSPDFKDVEASFLIKLGVYSSERARDIVRRINLLPELRGKGLKVYPCKDIKRPPAFSPKQLAFTARVPGMPQQENVLLGCFASEAFATSLLAKSLNTNISELQNAKLFQITE